MSTHCNKNEILLHTEGLKQQKPNRMENGWHGIEWNGMESIEWTIIEWLDRNGIEFTLIGS